MENSKTTIINLYGGPGTGKSTSAAYLYYLFKAEGKHVELVREYVKDWAWEGRKITTYDQIYFLGKQVRRESMLYGKVDWIVTDSPVMMNLYYAQRYCPHTLGEGIRAATLSFYRQAQDDGHHHIHLFLKRIKPYVGEGRYQTEAEARDIDEGVKRVLTELKFPTIDLTPDEADLTNALVSINKILKKA
jgi:nicotinamide riboside kinase